MSLFQKPKPSFARRIPHFLTRKLKQTKKSQTTDWNDELVDLCNVMATISGMKGLVEPGGKNRHWQLSVGPEITLLTKVPARLSRTGPVIAMQWRVKAANRFGTVVQWAVDRTRHRHKITRSFHLITVLNEIASFRWYLRGYDR